MSYSNSTGASPHVEDNIGFDPFAPNTPEGAQEQKGCQEAGDYLFGKYKILRILTHMIDLDALQYYYTCLNMIIL